MEKNIKILGCVIAGCLVAVALFSGDKVVSALARYKAASGEYDEIKSAAVTVQDKESAHEK